MKKGVNEDTLKKMTFQDRMKYISDLEMMKKNIANIINEKIEAVIEDQHEENKYDDEYKYASEDWVDDDKY